jgi:hypothetical protein
VGRHARKRTHDASKHARSATSTARLDLARGCWIAVADKGEAVLGHGAPEGLCGLGKLGRGKLLLAERDGQAYEQQRGAAHFGRSGFSLCECRRSSRFGGTFRREEGVISALAILS